MLRRCSALYIDSDIFAADTVIAVSPFKLDPSIFDADGLAFDIVIARSIPRADLRRQLDLRSFGEINFTIAEMRYSWP